MGNANQVLTERRARHYTNKGVPKTRTLLAYKSSRVCGYPRDIGQRQVGHLNVNRFTALSRLREAPVYVIQLNETYLIILQLLSMSCASDRIG